MDLSRVLVEILFTAISQPVSISWLSFAMAAPFNPFLFQPRLRDSRIIASENVGRCGRSNLNRARNYAHWESDFSCSFRLSDRFHCRTLLRDLANAAFAVSIRYRRSNLSQDRRSGECAPVVSEIGRPSDAFAFQILLGQGSVQGGGRLAVLGFESASKLQQLGLQCFAIPFSPFPSLTLIGILHMAALQAARPSRR
jgi:hypothetical protein